MLAHSLRLVFPRMTAPAARRRVTRPASAGGRAPSSASDPAVVSMRSAVPMLSLIRIGMPCRGPRTRPPRRSASDASATASASGLVSSTCRSAGPVRSSSAIRASEASTSARDVTAPAVSAACSSAMPRSSPAGTWPSKEVASGSAAARDDAPVTVWLASRPGGVAPASRVAPPAIVAPTNTRRDIPSCGVSLIVDLCPAGTAIGGNPQGAQRRSAKLSGRPAVL